MGNTKTKWYNGQRVDQQDQDTEQLYNKSVNTEQVIDFHGSGVVPDAVTPPVILNKSATDRSTATPKMLDGIGISVTTQPSDSTFGNQLEVTIEDAIFGTRPTSIYVFGRVYDAAKDSKSSIVVELLVFDREESQITKNYFTYVLGVVTQNFFGNATPIVTASMDNYNYEANLLPTNPGNTNVWTKTEVGATITENIITSGGSNVLAVSHNAGDTVNYILPIDDLRGNRFYTSTTRFSVPAVTMTFDDVLRPNRSFSNVWPIFSFDGNKAIGCTLIDDGGTEAVALFDVIDYLNNDNVLPSTAVITPFSWNDGAFHEYKLEVSVDNNVVTLTCDSTTIVSGQYSSFTTYLGGLSFDITFNSNTYIGFANGIDEEGNSADIEVDWHRQTITSEDATACASDRTQQIVGELTISEAEPMAVARDVVMAEQSVSPNIKFRSVAEATNALGNIVEPAFRVYEPENASVTVSSVVLNIIGGDVGTDDLDEDILTPNVLTTTLVANTSLSKIVGQKFLATANNLQKVRLLLSVSQDTTVATSDQFDWSGDIVVGIRKLATTTQCPTDEAPTNSLDYDPEFASIVEVSYTQEELLQNFGITLTDVAVPVDFDFSQTIIATPGNVVTGDYYAITVRRSGDIRTGTIVFQTGEDKYEDGSLTIFDGSSWLDDSAYDLWFKVYTDAIRINSGSAYDRGVRVSAAKSKTNSTTGLLEQDPHGPYSLVTVTRDEENYVVVEETESGKTVEAHPRTGNAVFSRLEDAPSFSVASEDALNTLKETLYPVTLACVTDDNCRAGFTITDELEYAGMAVGNTITMFDTQTDFTTLASEDLRGCIIAPDVNSCDSLYRIVKQEVTTQYYGDLNNDGDVDSDDITIMTADYLGESFSSETTQEKLLGQKSIDYNGSVLPENNTRPWSIVDDTDPGVIVSALSSGGVLTLSKSAPFLVGTDTTYYWTRAESLIESAASWEVNTRIKISSATFLNAVPPFTATMARPLIVIQGSRVMTLGMLNDSVNNKKYIGVGINTDSYSGTVFDINDWVTYELDFTEFHTYRVEETNAGMLNVYVDGATTAAISTLASNLPIIASPGLSSNSINFGDKTLGEITIQFDYVNYFIQSVSSINVIDMYKADVNGDGTVDSVDLAYLTDFINDNIPMPQGETFQTVVLTVEDVDDPCRTVDLVNELPNIATIPYSAVSYRLRCLCVWSETLLRVVDKRRMVDAVVRSNASTDCSTDAGQNVRVVKNDMVIDGSEIITPSGLPYHFDHEVVEITLNLPNYIWFKKQINIFDNFIKDKLKFSDGTYVSSSALQNGQVRVNAAIQSLNDFYEYNIEGDQDGYDGYGVTDSNVALYNETDGIWNSSPSTLIVGEFTDGKEYSTYLRFPVIPSDNAVSQITNWMPMFLGAMLKMTALNAASPVDNYRVSMIGHVPASSWRDLPSFDYFVTPPDIIDPNLPGFGSPLLTDYIRFKFKDAFSVGDVVTFPYKINPVSDLQQEMAEYEQFITDEIADSGGVVDPASLVAQLYGFTATLESSFSETFAEFTGQEFEAGDHIGWKIWRDTDYAFTANEYVSFDPGTTNITRSPKLNITTLRGDNNRGTAQIYDLAYPRMFPHIEQNALYFDHSTGMLHFNNYLPVRNSAPDSKTRIVLSVHLKKAGFANSNVEVTANQILEILGEN